MKKQYNYKNVLSKLLLIVFLGVGVFVFQAQDINPIDGQVTDRWKINDPAYNYSYTPIPQPMVVVTTPDGFDNFDMGIDNAESSIAVHPVNNTWFATGWNGVGFVPATHHTETGHDPWLVNNPSLPGTFGDPWMAYDSLGNLFYINLNASGPNGTWVVKSTNNGLTWGSPVAGCTGNDREMICADQTGGPYANYLYCGETTTGGASFYRSTDNGASFASMITLSPHRLPGFMACVGPNGNIQGGAVYAVTYDYTGAITNQTYYFHRSDDGGATWTTNISSIPGIGVSGIHGGSGRGSINGARTRAYPMIAADNSYGPYRGRLYCVWANNPGGVSGLNSEIYLKYSTDLGVSWSSTITVNDNPGTTADEWFPAVWCDKKDGKLYVKWYSTQENPAAFQTSVYAAYTTNGGTSFTASTKISNQSFPYPNVGPCSGCVTNYRGDYDGIVSNGKTSMSCWFDGRNATWGSYSAYFPDFALKLGADTVQMNGINDSQFVYVSIPAVKLYTDTALFSAAVNPPPGIGTLQFDYLNSTSSTLQNSLVSYPDSLRLRIKATGGVPTGLYTVTVTANGPNGTPVHVRTFMLNIGLIGLISNGSSVPESFRLYQNYPNPFNPKTNINFDIVNKGMVKLTVYDVTGKVVQTLVNGDLVAGGYTYEFDASNRASGIYFYRLETQEFTGIKKMILIK
ncbi:MAG: T9SS type A sorting domain-containing protein [Ignavibacteria bacterium]|nr:T9SS type A sorting domain-containing protein [Ignavibacteria bacterium]